MIFGQIIALSGLTKHKVYTVYIDSMKSITLQSLLDQGTVWAGELTPREKGRTTGHTQLDELLAHGGWPKQGVVDIQVSAPGQGELQLLLPSLAQADERLWVWLDPPLQPCAQGIRQAGIALKRCLILRTENAGDALWALERCLQSGCVDSALAWLRRPPNNKALRRLQMAAETGGTLAHLIHDEHWPADAGTHARVALWPSQTAGHLHAQIVRQRGGPQQRPIVMPLLAQQACSPPAPKPAQLGPVHLDPQPRLSLQPSLQLAL